MLDASAVSLAMPSPLEVFGWSQPETAYLVGLHDIGKADGAFQHRNPPGFGSELVTDGFPETADTAIRHERLSESYIRHRCESEGVDPRTTDAIARSLVAHHGYWDEDTREVAPVYRQAQDDLAALLGHMLGTRRIPTHHPSDLSAFGIRLAGHIVLCDWIASNESFFTDMRLSAAEAPEDYFTVVRSIAMEWVIKLNLQRGLEVRSGSPSSVVDSPRPIQDALLKEEIPPGLVVIEAPMGEGKTEAAWILAEKWRDCGIEGMYMALPTMATSDSLHRRYRDDYLGGMNSAEGVKLVHGMAWLRDDSEPDSIVISGDNPEDASIAETWFRPTRRAMLAAHGVGTIDQAMLAGMNVKFGFLRLHGLHGRVLVIDELHAYDSYMSAIISRLLEWCSCLGIPVILLSATLSSKQRNAMLTAYGSTGSDPGADAPYPLVTSIAADGSMKILSPAASQSRTLLLETHEGLLGDVEGTATLAKRLIENGGSCCVILNTVRQAQDVFASLDMPDQEKMLFHARFSAADRQSRAEKVQNLFGKERTTRPVRFVLIATQVVEQSLDVDFDMMISEIAPMDLLLQRSGRMHRHRVREYDPTLHLLTPPRSGEEFGGTGFVYKRKPLLRTLAIIDSVREIHLPSDFRMLVERCYGDQEWAQTVIPWESIREADRSWDSDSELLAAEGMRYALGSPESRRFRPVMNTPVGDDDDDGQGWRARTRLGATDRTALLVQPDELPRLREGSLPMDEVRNLYRKSIKLPSYLPLSFPERGYSAGVEARGRLRGMILLPLAPDGCWKGISKSGKVYSVRYDDEVGLVAGRVQ